MLDSVNALQVVGPNEGAKLKPAKGKDVEPDEQWSSTIEDSEDIDEKHVLKSMIDTAMGYLQRSLSIMIKSVMSKLYGTREILQKLHQINLELQSLQHNTEKKEMTAIFNQLVDKSCKFWKNDCVETEDLEPEQWVWHDWVWHCKRILPRDKKGEWNVSEDLTSWKLDICLKLITRAKVAMPSHNEIHIFASEYVCFKTTDHTQYNFVTLAQEAADVRNFYAHPPAHKEIVKRYRKDFDTVDRFALELLQWFKSENDNLQDTECCQEDVQNIRNKREAYFNVKTAKWEEVSNGLKHLNFIDFRYILVSTPCTSRTGVAVSKEKLAQLSNIPWAAVIDFDVASRQDGLLNSLCEPEEDHDRLKVSCQSSKKVSVVPFTYVEIVNAGKTELCRDGHIPWIFPHGDSRNETDKACPLRDYEKYFSQVQTPFVAALRKIASHIKSISQGAVSVILCYGSYACEGELPYQNFLSDLKCLCSDLKITGGHVVVLSDNPFLVKYFAPFPVLIFPLEILCEMIQNKLSFGQRDLSPLNMPSFVGLRPIIFDEEDFDLVHVHIAEHEFYEYQVQKKIVLQGEKISDSTLRSSIYHDLREKFYKGQRVTWISLNEDHAITRREESQITSSIRQMLHDRRVGDKTEPAKYVIYHSGGAGATTLARKILWHLRTEFPCVILKSNYKYSEGKIKNTSQTLKNLYEKLRSPILMLIDEEPSFRIIHHLTNFVQANGTPIVFLQVQRFNNPSEAALTEPEVKCSKDSFFLPGALHKDDANKLKQKLFVAFKHIEASIGDHSVAKMESSVAKPVEGGQVTDLEQNGTIVKSTYKQTGLVSYYLVNVRWENGKEDVCYVGSYIDPSIKLKLVYLKTEVTTRINRLYETFHFYGIMYLDEEFRQPMYEHIKKRLDVAFSHNEAKDETFKNRLLVLAHLSILFAFKVCESIHIKAFERLCYSITRSNRNETFKLEAFIPEAALEFMIITREGQFRITHPIVASEIIKFCSTALSFPVHYPPPFICKFLDFLLPDKDDQNEEAVLAVNRLLFYREYFDEGGYLTKKPFSELILTLEKQSTSHVLTVFEYASELINDCHSYGHYARYVSTTKDHSNALKILKQAENLAFRRYEEGLVLNIKGDIYRARLESQLGQAKSCKWKDGTEVFDSHCKSCQAYQEAYKTNYDIIPLFNEITVRLKLLKAMKGSKGSKEFLKFLHDSSDVEVSGSVNRCLQIIKELKELLFEEQETDFDSGERARLKLLESSLLDIIGSNKMECKKILFEVMTKYPNHINLPSITRSWIQLCLLDPNPTPEELDTCLNALEKNFKVLGHVDRDMRNWLLVTRHIPDIGGNILKIEEKLSLWKMKGPCINTSKNAIQVANNPLWVNFYLSICYFIQLIETKEEKVHTLVKKFNDANQELKQGSKGDRSQHRIKEWLCNDGTGFGRLKSGQIVQGEMMPLKGSVGIPPQQETLQYKQHKRYPYISWKGLRINFKNSSSHGRSFRQGEPVTFGVGFSFSGPQGIVFTESASSLPNRPNKATSESNLYSSQVTQTYSRVACSSMKTSPKK